jgi:ubiquinone/menaquinone biosynthesis C-methylase UbiE
MVLLAWLGLACVGWGQTPVPGATVGQARSAEADIPPPLREYHGREIAPPMSYLAADWLIRPERQREEDSRTLLRELRVKPGQVVCDLGCGNGYHTLPLARLVGPKGRVLAVDIQPEMLRLLERRATLARIDNIQLILGTVVDPRLPEAGVDLVLLVDVYHEFSHPEHMLQAIRRALKPEGLVCLVEFRAEDPAVPIQPLHKMSKKQMLRELTANGFKLVREFDELPWQHVMFFGKDEAFDRRAEPPP